jgi:hypothetical protein
MSDWATVIKVRLDYCITWVLGNTRFISSVEHDISQVSAANE